MAAEVGSLLARLGMDESEFREGIARADRSMRRFQRNLRRRMRQVRRSLGNATRQVVGLSTAVAALAGGAMTALVAASAKAIDEQQKFADVIGTTQAELAGLHLAAAEMSGMLDKQVNMALQRMTRRVAEAAKGTGEGQQALKDLGLDAQILARQDPAETFRQIGDAIREIPDEAEQLRIAFKLFDSEGARLVTTLKAGRDELDRYRKKAEDLGLVLSRDQTKSVEMMNDAFARTRLVIRGLGNVIAVVLAPIVTGIANDFEQASVKAQKFSQVEGFFGGVVSALGAVGDGAQKVVLFMAQAWELATRLARGPRGGFFDKITDPNIVQAYEAQLQAAIAFREEVENLEPPSDRIDATVDRWQQSFRELKAEWVQTNTEIDNSMTTMGMATKDIYDDIGDAIVEDFENVNQSLLNVFTKTLRQMASEVLSSNIRNVFTGLFSGGGSGGSGLKNEAAGKWLAKAFQLPGFATGGSFKVGGNGGTDSQVVAFRATPGERVTVATPAQQAMGGGVTVINNNDFRGVNSVSRQELQRALDQNRAQTEISIHNKMARGRFT